MLAVGLALTAGLILTAPPATQVVPCSIHRHLVACPVDVGLPERLLFIVDTGTRRTVIDPAVANRLGLATTPDAVVTLSGELSASQTVLPVMRLGSLFVAGLRVSVCDLAAVESSTGIHAAGIMGIDVLGRMSLTIDYTRSRITIGPFGALPHHAPLHTSRDFATVDVEIGHQRLNLVVDTGAEGLLVFAPANKVDSVAPHSSRGVGLGGSVALTTMSARHITIADSRLRADSISVANAADAQRQYDGDGLFGVRSLNATLVSLDFAQGELRWVR